jgi:hypothetical protein
METGLEFTLKKEEEYIMCSKINWLQFVQGKLCWRILHFIWWYPHPVEQSWLWYSVTLLTSRFSKTWRASGYSKSQDKAIILLWLEWFWHLCIFENCKFIVNYVPHLYSSTHFSNTASVNHTIPFDSTIRTCSQQQARGDGITSFSSDWLCVWPEMISMQYKGCLQTFPFGGVNDTFVPSSCQWSA